MELGKRIELAVKESGMQVTDFAEQIGMTRGSVYSLFRRRRIGIEILQRIDKVLGTKFSSPVVKDQDFAVMMNFTLGFVNLPNGGFIKDLRQLVAKYKGNILEN